MYKCVMAFLYGVSCALGVATYCDPNWSVPALTLLWFLYVIDSICCANGITCMRAIPARKVLLHHLPPICCVAPVLYCYWVCAAPASIIQTPYLAVAALSTTSGNEAVWVLSSFFSEQFIESKMYRRSHTTLTSMVLLQAISFGGYDCFKALFLRENTPKLMVPVYSGMLGSLMFIQTPLFFAALKRLSKI